MCTHTHTSDSGCSSGDIRLAGSGSSSTQGRVEICHNNQWGTVCDDSWDSNDAQVACRQLKYSTYGKLLYSYSQTEQSALILALYQQRYFIHMSLYLLNQLMYVYMYVCM